VIYQAQGMVTVQLGVNLAEAMARIRAYAYANQQPITDVARDIVSRKIRLEDDRS
jgi:AmiR/NasT family two-component response regulator